MKKTLCMLIALVLLFAASACGGPDASPTGSAAQPATGAPAASKEPAADVMTSGNPAASDEPVYGGVLRIIGASDTSDTWGIPWKHNTGDQSLLSIWSESLLVGLPDGSYEPWLATSFETDPANSEVRFTLREDVKFTDGTDLNAEVAVWNYRNAIETKAMNPAVIGAEVRGDYEIAIKLDGYYNGALDIFASHAFSLISKDNYEKNGEQYAMENPVGTGPFMMSERTAGERIVFVRNDNYWQDGKPYLDGIEYVEISDVMTQNAAMQSTGSDAGDVLGTSSGEQASTLLNSGAPVHTLTYPSGPVSMLPSSKDENSPLSKLEVRQAISYAIDRQAICDARGYGIWQPATQFIPAPYMGVLPDSYNLSYDPDTAKQLLADAGYPDGFEMTMNVMPNAMDKDAAVAVASMLEEIGIDVDLQFPESGAATDLQMNGWDGLLVRVTASLANMTTTFRLFLDPDYQYSPSMWRPVDVMKPVYLEARSTEEVQNDLIQELHKMVLDNMILVPVYYTYSITVLRDNVHDTGHTEWSAATVWMPADAWKSVS